MSVQVTEPCGTAHIRPWETVVEGNRSTSTSLVACGNSRSAKSRIGLCRFMETKAEALDLGHLHGRPVRGYHLGEVFGKCINLLLEEEKGCTDGTQLSFVNDKGELLHRVVSASKFVLSGYRLCGGNKATA